MSIPAYPANVIIPSRTLPNEASEFQKLKVQARAFLNDEYGINIVEEDVITSILKLDELREQRDLEALLPWVLEFTFHKIGPLDHDRKVQLPAWYWDAFLTRAVTMGRWEGLRYVSEEMFYEGMSIFAQDKAFNDYQLIHYWRRQRTDDMGSMPDAIIENMYRKRTDAK